jgi:hypothetical protein
MVGNVHWLVPRGANAFFTGRRKILEKLEQQLLPSCNQYPSARQKRFILHGLGGAGKSEICLKFLEENRDW